MKIVDEYYVLIKIGTRDKGVFRGKAGIGDIDTDTVFLDVDGNFVDDVRGALKAKTKKADFILIQDYERKHDFEPSGLIPVFVTNEITW